MDREIAKLINSIEESKIFDYIINSKYEEILDSVYEEMRKHFAKKTKDNGEKLEETFKKLEKKVKIILRN